MLTQSAAFTCRRGLQCLTSHLTPVSSIYVCLFFTAHLNSETSDVCVWSHLPERGCFAGFILMPVIYTHALIFNQVRRVLFTSVHRHLEEIIVHCGSAEPPSHRVLIEYFPVSHFAVIFVASVLIHWLHFRLLIRCDLCLFSI